MNSEPTEAQLERIKTLIKRKFNIELTDEEAIQVFVSMFLYGRAVARFLMVQKEKNNAPKSKE